VDRGNYQRTKDMLSLEGRDQDHDEAYTRAAQRRTDRDFE